VVGGRLFFGKKVMGALKQVFEAQQSPDSLVERILVGDHRCARDSKGRRLIFGQLLPDSHPFDAN
jgi:hypothetical protein